MLIAILGNVSRRELLAMLINVVLIPHYFNLSIVNIVISLELRDEYQHNISVIYD